MKLFAPFINVGLLPIDEEFDEENTGFPPVTRIFSVLLSPHALFWGRQRPRHFVRGACRRKKGRIQRHLSFQKKSDEFPMTVYKALGKTVNLIY